MLSLQPKDRLVLISAPKKFNIANVTDANVLSILNTGTTTYKFMLLHNKTSASPKPLDIINFMEETKWLITNGQEAIVDAYNWNSHAREIYYFP